MIKKNTNGKAANPTFKMHALMEPSPSKSPFSVNNQSAESSAIEEMSHIPGITNFEKSDKKSAQKSQIS